MAERTPLSTEEFFRQADKWKEEGNRLFKQGKYNDAEACYQKVLTLLDTPPLNFDKPKMTALVVQTLSNMCAVHTKLKNWERVIKFSTTVLLLDKHHLKAVYRRGVAYSHVGKTSLAVIDLTTAASLRPNDAEIKRELKRVQELSNGKRLAEAEAFPSQADPEEEAEVMARPYIQEKIPEMSLDDPRIISFIKQDRPFIIKDAYLVKTAVEKWNIEYLAKHMGNSSKFEVFSSAKHKFRYFDNTKNVGQYDVDFRMDKEDMTFREFKKKYEEETPEDGENKFIYLQQVLNQGVGEQIVEDFKRFEWEWIMTLANATGMGALKFNTLWISKKNIVTMCHYDEAFNFFAQVKGRKRFVLFSPDEFKNLYPFPIHHANDRQTQVDIDDPDLTKFPNFEHAKGMTGIVGANDVLFLPPYWFHHVKSLDDSISVNFWFVMNQSKPEEVKFPLSSVQRMAVRRNIESLIGEAMGPRGVGDFLEELSSGRFKHVRFLDREK